MIALRQEGAEYAAAFLERVRGGIAAPGELETLVGFLDGEMRQAFCRCIERYLGSPR